MSDTRSPILDELRKFLVAQRLTPGNGAPEAEIAAFEQRYGVRLPADLRAYFAHANGVVGGRDGAWDDELIGLWQLADVRPLSEEIEDCQTPGADQYFVFADWSIWAHGYVVHLSRAGTEAPVFIAFNPQLERIAESFDEFLRGYVRRDYRLLFGAPLAS